MGSLDIWGSSSGRGRKKKGDNPYNMFGEIKVKPLKVKPISYGVGLGYGKKEPERDTRRLFSPTQQKQILYQQDSKCGRCHKAMDPREIEFDHKKPWAAKGRTIVENGRALCGSCHKIVTHEYRLKQVDKKRKPKRESDPFGFNKKNPFY